MIYVQTNQRSNEVIYIHYQPFDPANGMGKTQEELLTTGHLVDSIPTPENKVGKLPVTKYDASTNTVYFDYVDRPLTAEEQLAQLQDQLMTADQKYKALDLTTAALADVQNAKNAQIREFYNQTLASGFSATVSGTQYTFGWQSDDITHMNAAQTSVSKGFLTFPILYADVHGNPVSIPDQATLDNIQSIATKFMMAQHQQALNLVGQVQSATTTSAVNSIQWAPTSY